MVSPKWKARKQETKFQKNEREGVRYFVRHTCIEKVWERERERERERTHLEKDRASTPSTTREM